MCDSAEKSCALGISAFLTRPNGNIVLFVDLGVIMKRVAIAAIAATCTIAFTQIASAADMPAKAPIVAPVAAGHLDGFLCWRQRGLQLG
jgi:hypothetical protein